MKPSEDSRLLEIVRATGEIYSRQVSVAAALMFLADLDHFTSQEVIAALSKCRKELRMFPSVAEVISRVDDGRPGVEEAWGMIPKSEDDSVVWTDEMAEAWGSCRGMIEHDPVAARMAFKETYTKIVAEKRNQGKKPNWFPSLGLHVNLREVALVHAASKLRIAKEDIHGLLGDRTKISPKVAGFIGNAVKQIPKPEDVA